MRRSRVYTTRMLAVGDSIALEQRVAHYLSRVLRLGGGDEITLFNGDGRDYPAVLRRDRRGDLCAGITGSVEPASESPLAITLVQATGRGERMDHALQKATELGVARIQPLTSERVGVKLDSKKRGRRLEHWQGVVISACEQSGRATVPRVLPLIGLEKWLREGRPALRLVLDPQAVQPLSAVEPADGSVAIVIGPEGGFSDREIEAMRAAGVKPVSLGPRVLRTETAGPAAIAVLQALAGDFKA
ncbi:MAG: 16S rRNA (uracil(1498)-N(3))-methyltransferase [Lysobacterales bacterium]